MPSLRPRKNDFKQELTIGDKIMPSALTYPGVYIEEIPSGVRTITGVATSITAFIGRARRGPTNEPVEILSFGDFERRFGGLQEEYLMSYAVRDFFLNGGSTALIVRLVHPNFSSDEDRTKGLAAAKTVTDAAAAAADVKAAATAAKAAAKVITDDKTKSDTEKSSAQAVADAIVAASGRDGAKAADLQAAAGQALPGTARLKVPTAAGQAPLLLEAADDGEWGNALRARVDSDGIDDNVAARYAPLTKADLFNLTIRNTSTGATERFLNVAILDSPRRVDRILESQSNLVRAGEPLPIVVPQSSDSGLGPDDLKIPPFSAQDTKRSVGVAAADQGADGGDLDRNDISAGAGLQDNKRGLYALNKADLFNLLCIPPQERGESTAKEIYQDALPYCVAKRAMLLVDSPASWSANPETAVATAKAGLPNDVGLVGEEARNAALFFPRVIESDPKREGQLDTFVPCGIIAGVMARTDTSRGVWKAPAGLDAALNGIAGLDVNLNDGENGVLNPLAINCLRFFPASGRVVWGTRTLRGADQLADEYKYVPVRRLALYIEESLYRGTQWVVFEPNDEPLWAQIRLNVGAFMHGLFRQGAFQGQTPKDAYFVKCDKETTPQDQINLGIVNIVVGFAPLKPAEFVVIKLQQMAGQIET
jgi:phage tail sheath protein FI